MKKRRSLRNIEKSGLSDLITAYTFERYETPEAWQKTAKARAQEFVTDHLGKWLCVLGAVGAGKSHLCTAVCVEMLNAGKSVKYMLWRDMSVKLKAAVTDDFAYERLIEPLKNADVLYIDDFFKTERGKSPTQGDVNLAHEILNYRYVNRRLITIISSELLIDSLLRIDEAIGSRIYERSRDYLIEFTGRDKNQRLRG